MTSQEAVTTLKGLLATALWYAQNTRTSDPSGGFAVDAIVGQFNKLSFDSGGLGNQVMQAQASWKSWGTDFGTDCKALLDFRAQAMDFHITDSGFSFNAGGFFIGTRTDDPFQQWWIDIAAPALESLSINDAVKWVTTPLKEGAQELSGILDYAGPVVVVVIVVLVLILAIHLT